MTYFGEKPWWDPRYKIRRSISIAPFDLLPGSESLCAIKIKKTNINDKIKPDYSDLSVVFQPEDDFSYLIPHYIVDEEEYLSIVFEPYNSIIYSTPATPDLATPYYYSPIYVTDSTPPEGATPSLVYTSTEPAVPISDNEYFVYYAGKTETKLETSNDFLNKDLLSKYDFGQLDDSTRWTFQKPSIYWSQNIAEQYGAQATFEFIGHKADIYFSIGSNYGYLEYQINDGERISVDCYSEIPSIQKLIAIETNNIDTTKVRLIILGNRNPASKSNLVKLFRVDYHQILVGQANSEEYYSDIGKAITTGS